MKRHLLLFALLLLISGAMFGQGPQVETPTFNPADGTTFTEALQVEISCSTESAIIFYTTNGSDPDENSDRYQNALHITTTTIVKAIAGVWDNGFMGFGGHYVFSQIATANYTRQYTIAVSANPPEGGTVSGGGTYDQGQNCSVTATANDGYNFVNWTEEGSPNPVSTDTSYNFTVNDDHSLVANFESNSPNIHTLTINYNYADGSTAASSYIESVNVGAQYSVDSPTIEGYTPDQMTVSGTMPDHDVTVDVTYNINSYTLTINYKYADNTLAFPPHIEQVNYNTTYSVDSPTIEGYTPDQVTVSGTMPDHVVTVDVIYNINSYTVSIEIQPDNGGSVEQSGDGTYNYHDECIVTATANERFRFEKWIENNNTISTNSTYTFTVTNTRNLVACFTSLYTITTQVDPTGAGTVIGGGTFPADTTITLTAIQNDGYTFNHWQDGSTQNPRTITVTSDSTFIAIFTPNTYIITVKADPPEGGTTYGNGAFLYNTTTTIGVNANSNYDFIVWQDGNTQNPRRITVTGNATYTAFLNEPGSSNYLVTANVSPTEAGYVTGTGSVPPGDTTILEAHPNNGYTFDHWNDDSTQNPRTVIVNSNLSFTAYFTQIQYYITTHVSPSGTGSVTGGGPSHPYHYGDQAILTANPNGGYTFDRWNDGSTQNPRTITVTGNATYTAYFTQAGPTEYTITTDVTPESSGTVNGGGTYPTGTQVTLTAIPNEGYTFDHWQDDNTDNPRTITVTGNATYTATFKQDSYTITTNVTPTDSGTVTGGGSGFHYGNQTILTANANPGYTFDHWQDGNTQNRRTITVTGNATYTATFKQDSYTITVKANNDEWGTVTGGGEFNYGQTTTLRARANEGYEFEGWNDGNPDNPRQITVTCDSTFIAIFDVEGSNYYNVTTAVTPIGAGRVTGGGTYPENTDISLNAIANIGYTFSHWQDGNTNNPRSFTVNESLSFTAHFTTNTYTINVVANPEEGGVVTGGGPYAYGVDCTLKARSKPGYTFINWTENNIVVSTNDTYTFTVECDRNLIANFTSEQQYTITVSANPEEGGTVNGGGSYAYDVTCTLKAIPNTGYTFTNWTENGTAVSSNSTYEFTVTTDRNLIANFEKDESLCIEDPKNIEPKYHTDKDGHKYILLLVYPNHNDIYTYQWSYARPNSNSDSLIYNPIGIDQPYYYEEGGLSDGFYKVSITKKGEGCSPYVAEYPVTGNKNNNKLRIYPNPSRRDHNIVVVNDSNGPSRLSIYSTDGRPLHAQTVTDNQTTLNLNLPSGVYIVYLTDSDGYTKIGKLVIQ